MSSGYVNVAKSETDRYDAAPLRAPGMRRNANTPDATVSRDLIPRSPLRGALNNFSSLSLLSFDGLWFDPARSDQRPGNEKSTRQIVLGETRAKRLVSRTNTV